MEPTQIRRHPSRVEPDERAWETTVSRDVLVGARIGEYVVRRKIGAGGMGIVYEAENPLIHRRVALKLIRPTVAADRGLLEEARAANVVRHRGIVDVYGFGELPIGQYLVMEFLEGTPLDALLRKKGRLEASEVVPLLDELLAVLDVAHAHGLIHRDLKPSNLFIVDEAGGTRYLKLLDFGLAKRLSVEATVAGKPSRVSMVVGTPHYMAPEQAQGLPVDARSDLYSVGLIAFELLTGKVPFDGPDPFTVMTKVVNDAPPRPSELAPVPPQLERLVLRLLDKDPAARPATAAAVREELRAMNATSQPAKANREDRAAPAPVEQAGRTHRELPRARLPTRRAAVLGALIALAGAAGALSFWRLRAPDRPATAAAPVSVEPAPAPPAPKSLPEQTAPDKHPQPLPKKSAAIAVHEPKRTTDSRPGHLRIGVSGGRADVFVDGLFIKGTPIPDQEVSAGAHHLKLVAPNNFALERTVTVKPGETLPVQVSWDPVRGELR